MKILLGSEFFWPSVGGVQKVMHELAKRLVLRGHQVTVATSRLPERTATSIDGIQIAEFDIRGNLASGLAGADLGRYRELLVHGGYDVFLVKAAQQWTFDAALEVLPRVKAKKLHIPCGYSGLLLPQYAEYFRNMPEYLRLFDRLIFYSDHYCDIDFARQHHLRNLHVLCNGASEEEFDSLQTSFRDRYQIPEDHLLFLTVGSPILSKGHGDCLELYAKARLDRPSTLVMIGPYQSAKVHLNLWRRLTYRYKPNKRFRLNMFHNLRTIQSSPDKQALLLEIDRPQTIEAFKAADLFLFCSHIEYSPLVLFEAAAAGTSFLSVEVGNSAEIAEWTGAGVIVPPAERNEGSVRPDITAMVRKLEELCRQPELLKQLGEVGRRNWREKFTWDIIAARYEELFS